MSPQNSEFSGGQGGSHYNNPAMREQRKYYRASGQAEREELLNRVYALNRNMGAGIQKIIDFQPIDGGVRVDWEAFDGVSLDEKYCWRNRRMSLESVRECLRQIAGFLIPLHGQGIAHLHIQPGSIRKIMRHDVADQVIMAGTPEDITTIKPEYRLEGWHLEKASSDYYSIYSYLFLAPEIFDHNLGQPGTAADVYALAVSLCLLLTGHGPFDKTETMPTQIRRQHLHETPALRGLPPLLRPVFLHALGKDPRDRPTMREFYQEFELAYQQIVALRRSPKRLSDILTQVVSRRQAIILLMTLIALVATLSVSKILSQLVSLPLLKTGHLNPKVPSMPIAGATLLTFTGHQAVVNAAIPSTDGKLALSADQRGRLMVWDTSTGHVLLDDNRRHEGASIVSVAWVKNNQAFASLDRGGTVWLWQLQDGEYKPFASHCLTTPTNAVAWSPIGNHLVVATRNHLAVYDYAPRNPFGMTDGTYVGHKDIVNNVAISQDGKFAASGSDDTTVQVWYVETAQQKGTYRGHSAEVSTVAISPDGQFIASGGVDQTVQIWDVQEHFGGVQFANRQEGPVCSIAWSPDGHSIATGGDGKVIHVYDLDGSLRYTYRKHQTGIASVAWLPDGRRIISAGGAEVHIWRAP